MSRNFDLTVRIKGIDQEEISAFLEQHFQIYMDVTSDLSQDDIYIATGVVTLYCGQADFEAHEEIEQYFKGINPNALVQTQWTNLDDLPYDQYGDNFEGEGDEDNDE